MVELNPSERDSVYRYSSGVDERVFHIPRERLQAIRSMEEIAWLIPLEDLGDILARYKRAAASLTPLEVEGRVLSDDGEGRWGPLDLPTAPA